MSIVDKTKLLAEYLGQCGIEGITFRQRRNEIIILISSLHEIKSLQKELVAKAKPYFVCFQRIDKYSFL